MNILNRIAILGVLVAVANLSACIVTDHGPYRYENGDRVDRNGVREAHWCDHHRDDPNCRI